MTERLGYLKGGAEDVISHAWFSHFDWDALVNGVMDAPWKPQLKTADDTSYFDPEGMNECMSMQASEAASKLTAEETARWQHIWDAFASGSNNN